MFSDIEGYKLSLSLSFPSCTLRDYANNPDFLFCGMAVSCTWERGDQTFSQGVALGWGLETCALTL